MTLAQIHPPEQHMSMEKFMEWIDHDNDKRISKHELREALREQGLKFTKFRAWKAMRKVDGNRNGVIDPGEMTDFLDYMKTHWNIVIDVGAK